MKLTFAILAIILATAYAALPSSNEYLPPLEDASPTSNVDLQSISESSPLADDGYRYKTVKRLRLRHRRDVNELPSNEYLPPAEESQAVAPAEESASLADDGYRYKTVKRIRYRHRRDVNELPSNEYLPPTGESQVVEAAVAPAEESATLADDGYRYKTVKRIRYRHRRDVNELPSNEYLPPTGESQVVEAAVAPAEESATLADDGYRYKTVKRIRYRHRRDVNELPSNEYLPPTGESQVVEAAVAPAEESATLADDGYRYKTVKRIRYRHRRDVNELPSNEYLPPTGESQVVEAAVAPAEESATLADDGYRYKTVKRIRYRHRRDVNELPSNEYLPPTGESQVVEAAVAPAEESATLADDGYRYKTVKRIRYRHRRDVNELPSNEYLPPTQSFVADIPIVAAADFEEQSQDTAVLAADGYRYKAVKRIRYRHRRDVSEFPSNEYLPPAEESQVASLPAEESAVLADDGYRYKTAKRVVYRRRF